MLRLKTQYNPTRMPQFDGAKETRSSYQTKSKAEQGLGEMAKQSKPISRIQLSYILHHDYLSHYTPKGLLSLFYIILVVTFLPRVREEVQNMTRGDFKCIYNPDGTIR